MEKRYLIDSNIIIYLSINKIPDIGKKFVKEIIDRRPEISVITKMELLGFNEVPVEIVEFTNIAEVYPVEDDIVDQTIELRKKIKIKLPDAIIAATAIKNHLTLITRNKKDFSKINFLNIIDPFEM